MRPDADSSPRRITSDEARQRADLQRLKDAIARGAAVILLAFAINLLAGMIYGSTVVVAWSRGGALDSEKRVAIMISAAFLTLAAVHLAAYRATCRSRAWGPQVMIVLHLALLIVAVVAIVLCAKTPAPVYGAPPFWLLTCVAVALMTVSLLIIRWSSVAAMAIAAMVHKTGKQDR